MKIQTLRASLILLVTLFVVCKANAQYTINERKSVDTKIDTVATKNIRSFELDVNTPAYQRFLRQQKWHDRNFFETNNALTITQFGYINSASGENSFNGRLSSLTTHVYQNDDMVVASYLNASYGMGQTDGELTKLTDNFQLNSELGYVLYNKWNYAFGLNLTSQFTKTYTDQTVRENYSSKFFAPANLKPYIGLTYQVNTQRKITISPISGNLLMVLDDSLSNIGAFGIEAGNKFKLTGGALLNVQWNADLLKDGLVKYRTTFQTFWDYNSPPNVDWENWIEFRMLNLFTVNFYLRLIYDESIDIMVDGPDGTEVVSNSHLQLRQSLGFGISYIFKNKNKPKYTIIK